MTHSILTRDELVDEYVKMNRKNMEKYFELVYETDKLKKFRIYNFMHITFWDNEIVISGDSIDPNVPNGLISNRCYDLSWFLNQYRSPDYLCSKFLFKSYDPHNMYLFLNDYLDSEESSDLNEIAKEDIRDVMSDYLHHNEGALMSVEQIYDFLTPYLGYDTVVENMSSYNHLAASRLIGINQLFTERYNAVYNEALIF
jgi:hypothetical protein